MEQIIGNFFILTLTFMLIALIIYMVIDAIIESIKDTIANYELVSTLTFETCNIFTGNVTGTRTMSLLEDKKHHFRKIVGWKQSQYDEQFNMWKSYKISTKELVQMLGLPSEKCSYEVL